jgi:S-DNA-T family DNA segregation ATPase FtsK/SpoIIIE
VTVTTDEPLSIIRQLELMRSLQRLANERAQEEARVRNFLADALQAAAQRRDSTIHEADDRNSIGRVNAQIEYESTRQSIQQTYELDRDTAQSAYKNLRNDLESSHTQKLREATAEKQERTWEIQQLYEGTKERPREEQLETEQRLGAIRSELAVLEQDSTSIMKMRRQWQDFAPLDPQEVAQAAASVGEPAAESNDPVESAVARASHRAAAVRAEALKLYKQWLPKLFEDELLLVPFLVAWAIAAAVVGSQIGWPRWQWWLPVSAAVAAVIAGLFAIALFPAARRQSRRQFQVVRQLLAATYTAIDSAAEAARQKSARQAQAMIAKRDQEIAVVRDKFSATVEEKGRWKDAELERAGSEFPKQLAEIRSRFEQESTAVDRNFNETLARLAEDRERSNAEALRRYDEQSRELHTAYERDWKTLAEKWQAGYAAIQQAWDNMADRCERLFPDWNSVEAANWQRAEVAPPALRFGRVALELGNIKNGIPQDDRLRPERTSFVLPALMTLKEHPAMLLLAEEEGRRAAIDVLQSTMLRFLTGMPPGKVRFTILDPVGLGESFGSFMHLADYDELLVSSRIWTEPRQIEEQLTRLTEHMETVLQKYLRNEFATIDEYNERAGEVAEPFDVLVVANFPANFNDTAARKLLSIVQSGPRCGIYTLLSIDRKQRMPSDFPLEDVSANAVVLDWKPAEKRFRWRYPAFEQLPLNLDGPPTPERFNEVVRTAGAAAKKAMRVEVPFETVAPQEGQLWTGDSGQELVVPLGRAGAMRLQSVRLGRGTSQHLLVAGKTGSGKSTFLHAFITNAALHYSPDQVEFYLIDFKKGVEFKTYATHRLPHARVIAIESEREFGLSVLERLDAELVRRGEMFRVAGVQDLPSFRAARPGERMPRVVLVVDEFQELFVEDDKLGQDGALLLDRLVRQGRAFGVHVMLGSQTLSGAYSLARSTMGQMAVRVALQCSEADAHVILSDERNMAARYLSRPGEAIYNDQNGLLAGNQPFQVVWLSESQRVDYLRKVEDFAAEKGVVTTPAIVFEGDQAADPSENKQLVQALANGSDALPAAGPKAWLGAAVAIKEPTFVHFSPQAGNNLLVVGSEEESAFGVLANAVVALSAQGSPRFFVLDGTRPDSQFAGAWQKLSKSLSDLITVANPRDTARVIAEIAAEATRRESASDEHAPPWYLIIHDAGRFRELRRGEDDFSFSSDRDKPPRPDKQWAEIIRNGPAWSVHSLVWCDSYNDVNRLVDRATLREFELRVLFQMSAADSTNLLDSPAASRLRQHRGLFYSDDLGTQEKFRPYGPPSEDWLARVRQSLQQST